MTSPLFRRSRGPMLLVFAGGLAACSGHTAGIPSTKLGFGTPGVDRYAAGSQATTLQAQLDQCRQIPQTNVAGQTDSLAAACQQLQRTQRNQPGNAVR